MPTNSTSSVQRPSTTDELTETLRESAGASHTVRITGAGSAQEWGGRCDAADIQLDTTALTGIIKHNPADLTLAVHAGTPLRTLQTALAAYGQHIAIDPARTPAGATIGGLLATADSGPLRQAYGGLQTLVIGTTLVTPSGTVVRSGGEVIKNVAGYDLAKLLHGSLGTLGTIAEVILRLHPLPDASVTVSTPTDPDAALSLARTVLSASLEPAALEWNAGTLAIRLDGTAAGVEYRTNQLLTLAKDGAIVTEPAETRLWENIAHTATGESGDTVLRLGTAPRDMSWLVEHSTALAEQHGVTVDIASSVGIGMHNLRIRSGDQTARGAYLAALREDLTARRATCVVCRPGQLPSNTATRGAPPDGIAVMRALKNRFDPDGRFGVGRFAPWF